MANIFNQEALEALDDHSEAKEMARVASPQLKIVLGAMVAMMVVVVYWCIFGTVNYKVNAQGVVFPFGEATPVTVPYDGTVSRMMITPGTAVTYGTGIVEIHNALSTSTVTAPRDGVVISTLPIGTQFKAGEPVAWLLPQTQQMAGREMLCYVTYNDLRKLKTGQQVQAVIDVAACRHVDIAAGHTHGHVALPADMVPVEGMRRVPVIYREIPDESKGLGIVGGTSGGFQPPCFPAHVIQGNEGKHRVDPGFLVQDV